MKIRYFEKRGQIWLDFRDATGARRRVPSGCADLAAAERAAPGILARHLAPAAPPSRPATRTVPASPGSMTLREAFKLGMRTREEWIQSKDKVTLERTYAGIGLPDEFPVAQLTRDKVRELRAEWMLQPGKRKGTTLSASTINHRLSMLNVLLQVADLDTHGVRHLSVKKGRRTRRIQQREVQAVQSWLLANAHLRGALALCDMITVALEIGAREGELLGLEAGDLTADTATFRDTKNSTTRVVPLPPASQRILAARRGLPGGPFAELTQSQLGNLWAQARAAIGLAHDPEFVFHALRHECASQMAEAGVHPMVMQAVLGHSSIATTQIYTHASLQAMRDAQLAVQQRAALQTIPEGGRMQ